MILRLFFSITCLLATCAVHAQQDNTTLPSGVQVVVNGHRLPADSYTLYVQEVGASEAILAVNPDLPLNPASTIKTLTTLAGLEQLGPHYTWRTRLYALGTIHDDGTLEGDLLIQGGGDPFLVEEHFRAMLKTLQRRGITRITGDLVIDDAYFDPSVSVEPLIDNDSNRSYNLLPHAMMANFQSVNFYFYPHTNGRDVIIKADPALPNLRIDNRLRLRADAACNGFQRGISFNEDAASGTVIFSGQYPSRCGEYLLTRTVLDAPNYTHGLFTVLWRELGGSFEGGVRLGSAPAGQVPVVNWPSPPLADIIKSINKFSNNMMTRHLLLTLGAERYQAPATVEKGIEAVKEYLLSHGIDPSDLVMMNGSGLSRDTRLTSALLGAVLQRGHDIPTMHEFIASLPLAGLDGTMRNRLNGNGTRGSMHIKTGSLSGVAGIAGYVHSRSGRHFVVVALLNNPQADAGPGQELSDALLNWVWQL